MDNRHQNVTRCLWSEAAHKAVTRCPSFDLNISTAIGPERGRLQICDLTRS